MPPKKSDMTKRASERNKANAATSAASAPPNPDKGSEANLEVTYDDHDDATSQRSPADHREPISINIGTSNPTEDIPCEPLQVKSQVNKSAKATRQAVEKRTVYYDEEAKKKLTPEQRAHVEECEYMMPSILANLKKDDKLDISTEEEESILNFLIAKNRHSYPHVVGFVFGLKASVSSSLKTTENKLQGTVLTLEKIARDNQKALLDLEKQNNDLRTVNEMLVKTMEKMNALPPPRIPVNAPIGSKHTLMAPSSSTRTARRVDSKTIELEDDVSDAPIPDREERPPAKRAKTSLEISFEREKDKEKVVEEGEEEGDVDRECIDFFKFFEIERPHLSAVHMDLETAKICFEKVFQDLTDDEIKNAQKDLLPRIKIRKVVLAKAKRIGDEIKKKRAMKQMQ
uniref:Protein 2 n=1 Tax=Melilotus virus 1_Off TaxID=2977976 RepID=A0A9N6YIX2_9RHAB|nr:TPA_asm: protein 2 [Melilotus virus 1_Off]